jgi:hypothetical protein
MRIWLKFHRKNALINRASQLKLVYMIACKGCQSTFINRKKWDCTR